jgi:hypothetical protein
LKGEQKNLLWWAISKELVTITRAVKKALLGNQMEKEKQEDHSEGCTG